MPGLPTAAVGQATRPRSRPQVSWRACGTEQALTLPDGLPGREWYRHQISAPGLYTGYGAKTLPGIREAVEAKHYDEANAQAQRVTQVLGALVRLLQ